MKEETFKFRRRLSRFECGCGQCKDWHLFVTEEELAPLREEMKAEPSIREGGRPFEMPYFSASMGIPIKHLAGPDYKGEVEAFLKSLGDGKLVDIEITIREVAE
jgi:hypothetical protein